MATTPLGIPLVDFDTDQPNGAGQINAVAEAVDALLVEQNATNDTLLLPAARLMTGHAQMTGLSSGSNPVGGPWPTTTYNVGDITYASGIFTVTRGGLYVWGITYVCDGSNAASTLIPLAYINGSAPGTTTGGGNAVYPNAVGGNIQTAGGPVALNAGDQLQLNMFIGNAPSGVLVTPDVFSLHLVG